MSIKSEYFEYLKHIGHSVTLREFTANSAEPAIALRHDVDHDINLAMEMAFWEKEKGCRSTFFLLHTAEYWNAPQFIDKALQIQDFGHEIGLHVNILSEWMRGKVDDVYGELKNILDELRHSGLKIFGISPHGDPLCYQKQFINYWCFSELKPDDPHHTESGLNAEGITAEDGKRCIDYSASHILTREDNRNFPLWSDAMEGLGLAYDAIHTTYDAYYSDSHGKWLHSRDPLHVDLSRGRHQIMIHPEHWRGLQQHFFFLSAARSGSKWLANFLNTATPMEALHEFTLNHRFKEGELIPEKRTGHGFSDLVKEKDEARRLLIESRKWIESLNQDFAETNVYLERFLPVLKEVFPEAVYVHLHRDPKDVVRSILNRNWYEIPIDKKHPDMEVDNWESISQFEKSCWYARITNESLLDFCEHRIIFESMVKDIAYLSNTLLSLGIPVFSRLSKRVFDEIINANLNQKFPEYSQWNDEHRCLYHGIMWPVILELGYENSYGDASYERDLGVWLKKYVHKRRAFRNSLLDGSQKEKEVLGFANIEFKRHQLKHFHSAGCKLRVAENGLTIIPTGRRHAYCVIGDGAWYRLQGDEGWQYNVGTYIRGWLEAVCEGEGFFQLFCLMFDEKGEHIGRRSLGLFRKGDSKLVFSYRPLYETKRFSLAVHMNVKSLPRNIELQRLVVEEVQG